MFKIPAVATAAEWARPVAFGRFGLAHLIGALIVATVAVSVVTALVLLQSVAEADQTHYRRAMRDHAEALGNAVDLEFELAETALEALSVSSALARDDLDAFEGEMRALSAKLGKLTIGLTGADGLVLINTWQPPGDRRRTVAALPSMQAIISGTTQISDVFRSRFGGLPTTVVAVPILDPARQPGEDPRARYALSMGLRPDRFQRLIAEQRFPEAAGLEVSVSDRVGTVMARSGPAATATDLSDRPGTAGLSPPAPPAATERVGNGLLQIQVRAARSGYQVLLSVPETALTAPLQRARWRTLGVGATLLGLSFGLAMLLAKRLRGELRRIAVDDAATTEGVPRKGLREVDLLAATLARTRRERDRATAELRALFAVSPIGMARADLGGRVQEANTAFLDLLGLGAPDLAAGAVRWDELTPPELLPRDERAIAEAVRTGRCTPYEKAFQRSDGTQVPVLVSIALLDRNNGECAVFVVDLSALKRTEAALAESEARLGRALAAAEMASWDWDMETGKVAGSPGREALYGRPAGSMSDGAAMLAAVHPDDRAATRMVMEAALDPNGQVRCLHSRGSATRRDALGRVLHMSGVVRDVSALKDAQERRELLVREVDHRAKNVLAVVQAVLKLTRAEDPRQYARVVEGRISALAKAHTLLSRQRWAGADLRAMIAEELEPFGAAAEPEASSSERVTLHGPPVFLSPWAVQPLSMALHELATNAAKYGALADSKGRLEVCWRVGAVDGLLTLEWTEFGGPGPVAPPSRKGFGTRVIDGAIHDQLGGQLERRWLPTGLACRLVLPAERIAGETGPRAPRELPMAGRPVEGAWSGRRVLVVEDDALIAQGLVTALEELGIEVVGPASTLEQALGLAATAPSLDAAVLDINLAGRLAVPVADVLAGRRVPMVFASGYGSLPRGSLPDRHLGTPLLLKPVKAEVIVAALTRQAAQATAVPMPAAA